MGLALLATASMPLKYWDQAFLTATHLINRTPSKHIAYDTPLHRLLGAIPDYSTLRFSVVSAGLIFDPITHINSNSDLLVVPFLVTTIFIRATNV
jgi:hypothetical protein